MKVHAFISKATLLASLVLTAALTGCQTTTNLEDCKANNLTRVIGGGECLVIETYGVKQGGSGKPLVVFIHGDGSSGGPSDYMYEDATAVSYQGGIGIVLIRPGYFDSQNNYSSGTSYRSRGDGYRQHIIDAIGGAIETLKAFHGSSHVVLAGHSGGAAISGVLMGQKPELADAAVLAACPCNVSHWRSQKGRSAWSMSRSPHNYADDVSQDALIIALTGSQDTNTQPNLAEKYVNTLKGRGVNANFVLVDGESHNGVRRSSEFASAYLKALFSKK